MIRDTARRYWTVGRGRADIPFWGFVDSFKKKGTGHNGYPILGSELDLPALTEKLDLHGVILAIGNNWTRSTMADKIGDIAPGLDIVTAVHPGAIIGKDVKIGKGTVILPGAIVNAGSGIGTIAS